MATGEVVPENGVKDGGDPAQGGVSGTPVDPELKSSVFPTRVAQLISSAVASALSTGQCGTFPELESVSAADFSELSVGSPLLAFINPKSGGRLGGELYSSLCSFIGTSQVFDLSKVKKPGLVVTAVVRCLEVLSEKSGSTSLKSAREGLRILVAGGDGTVGWVLSSMNHLDNPPPVGVIPLGTGNDLSRAYGWGPSFSSAAPPDVKSRLLEGITANTLNLDCWKIKVTPSSDIMNENLNFPHALKSCQNSAEAGKNEGKVEDSPLAYEGLFYNYFSFGMDAQIAYGFHRLREEKPWLARGRVANKAIYSGFGCSQGWFCASCSPNKIRTIQTVAKVNVKRNDSDDWEEIPIPPQVRALVLLNLQSYAGGRNPWGMPNSEELKKNGWSTAKPNDGLLEVVGLHDGWHTALVMAKVSPATRLTQARSIRLELHGEYRSKAYLQVDGEPWRQPLSGEEPTIVEISPCPNATMLLGKKSSGLEDDQPQ